MSEPLTNLWLVKVLGAVGGSAISLAYLLPKGRREAMQRLAVGMVSGFIFGPMVVPKAEEWGFAAGPLETLFACCAAVSAVSWVLIGFVLRRFNKAGDDD